MKVRLRNRVFEIRYFHRDNPRLGETGELDQVININTNATPREIFSAHCDEVIHVCLPDVDNDAVDDTSEALAVVLFDKRGYRRKK